MLICSFISVKIEHDSQVQLPNVRSVEKLCGETVQTPISSSSYPVWGRWAIVGILLSLGGIVLTGVVLQRYQSLPQLPSPPTQLTKGFI